MIPIPSGWSAREVGTGLLVTRAGDESSGSIQYVERLRPLRDVAEIVAAVGVPDGFLLRGTTTERGVTAEGELTELVVHTGRLDGVEIELYVGVVMLDDYYARLTGIGLGARLGATVRELLAHDVHMLGQLRRRRYRHETPAGWTVTRELFRTRLDAGDARMLVAAAVPTQPGLEETTLERLGADPERLEAPLPIVTARRLSGRLFHLGDATTETYVAFLEHAGLAYAVRLDGRRGATPITALRALLDSIEPVRSSRTTPAEVSALHHWAA